MKRLLEVKKQIGNLSKNSKNPFFKSQYLDLNDLLNAVEPLLHEQGLLLLQPINGGLVWSQIIDTENGSIIADSSIELPNITDPQKLGSCITYFRRYTLKSLLSISEVDDDGNKASQPTKQVVATKPTIKDELLTKGIEKANGDGDKLQQLIDKFDLTTEQSELINKSKNDNAQNNV